MYILIEFADVTYSSRFEKSDKYVLTTSCHKFVCLSVCLFVCPEMNLYDWQDAKNPFANFLTNHQPFYQSALDYIYP